MIVIRPYLVSDCEALAKIFKRAVLEIASKDYSPAQILAWAPDSRDTEKFAARLAAKPTYVAECDGTIAGYSDLESDGHIDMLFVNPDFQRQGVATTLLLRLINDAKKAGLTMLHSEVSITARPVFERQGFTVSAAQTVEANGQSFRNFQMKRIL